MFIVKVNLALDDVYGALDTDQQSRQNQIVYHNKIYPSIPGSTPHPPTRDYVKCLLLPESTLPSQNMPPFKHLGYMRPSRNLPSVSE